jgi:hypothetical protein
MIVLFLQVNVASFIPNGLFLVSTVNKDIRIPHHPRSVASSTVVNQTENIVEDEVAALSIWKELEGLGIVHGLLLLIDLQDMLEDGPR